MTDTRHDDALLVVPEYVLGLLSPDERAAFKHRLNNNKAVQTQVRQWEEHFSAFANDFAEIAPPEHILEKIEARLFGAKPRATKLALWNSLGFWRGLALASVAGVISLAAWTLTSQQTIEMGPELVAEVAGAKGLVKLATLYDTKSGVLRIHRVEGLPANGRSFELWLIAGKDQPISLGVLPNSALTTITLPEILRVKAIATTVLAITDEPLKGAPFGKPTGEVLAAGTLNTI